MTNCAHPAQSQRIFPELVAPGGSLDKCLTAYAYGADACYVGIQGYGLRKSADNLSFDELKYAKSKAIEQHKKLYITLNAIAYESDLLAFDATVKQLENIQPDACIVSDLGLAKHLKKHSSLSLHVSTQASVSNVWAAKAWKKLGAKRVVLARECSLQEAKEIQNKADIEVEVFVHGAMCSSYSGRCIISNVTAGRDSNRGGCIQSCRHEYHIKESDESMYIMNSKDLNALPILSDCVSHQISAFKIEGRMKSKAYLATVVQAYRQKLDSLRFETKQDSEPLLANVSHRPFTQAFLQDEKANNSLSSHSNTYEKNAYFCAEVKQNRPDEKALILTSKPIQIRHPLLLLHPQHAIRPIKYPKFFSLDKQPLTTQIKQNTLLFFECEHSLDEHSILLETTQAP